MKLYKALFADDTTEIGEKKELDIGVKVTKEVMARLEERNNENMEEVLEFGEEAGNSIRMLCSYMEWKEES